MKYEKKAKRFVELSQLDTPTPAEKQERQALHDELFARGFNPRDPKGIIERAIVFDHRTTVKNYCEVHERVSHADRCTASKRSHLSKLEHALKDFGLTNLDRHHLERILGSFEPNRRLASKASRKKTQSLARQQADTDQDYRSLIDQLVFEAKMRGCETEDEIEAYIDQALDIKSPAVSASNA